MTHVNDIYIYICVYVYVCVIKFFSMYVCIYFPISEYMFITVTVACNFIWVTQCDHSTLR